MNSQAAKVFSAQLRCENSFNGREGSDWTASWQDLLVVV